MSDSEVRAHVHVHRLTSRFVPARPAQRSLPFVLRPVGMHGKMLRQLEGCQLEARWWYCWNEKTGETRCGARSKFSCVVDFPRTLEMHTRSCTRQPVRLPPNNGHSSLSWPCVKPMGTQFATINQEELSDTQKGSFTRTAYQVPAHGEQRD